MYKTVSDQPVRPDVASTSNVRVPYPRPASGVRADERREAPCRAWEACMQRDPTVVGRTNVVAETFAGVINSFVDPISWKTMASDLAIRPFSFSRVALLTPRSGIHPRHAQLPHHTHQLGSVEHTRQDVGTTPPAADVSPPSPSAVVDWSTRVWTATATAHRPTWPWCPRSCRSGSDRVGGTGQGGQEEGVVVVIMFRLDTHACLLRRVAELGACPISLPAVVMTRDQIATDGRASCCCPACVRANSSHLSLAHTSTPSFLIVSTILAAFNIQPPISGTTTPLAASSHIHRDTAKHGVQTRGHRSSVVGRVSVASANLAIVSAHPSETPA